MFKHIGFALFYCITLVFTLPATAYVVEKPNLSPTHAVSGELKKFDAASKTAVIKLADGTEEVFKVTEKTAVHGVESGAKMAALAGKEGAHFVVHYSVVGADKTAESFRYLGSETPKIAKGTITAVDKSGHVIAVKTEDGAEETFHVAKHCTIETGKGAASGAEAVGDTVKEGGTATIHYTTEGGKKVAHFVQGVF